MTPPPASLPEAARADAASLQAFYAREGYLSPLRVLPDGEAAGLLARLQAFEASRPGGLPQAFNAKVHLLFPWLWDLVCDPRVLAPVTAVLGPDVLCWASSFFSKAPGTETEVPWHQDGTYWGLTEPRALTAWIAFTPSTAANGGMQLVPRSHTTALPHVRTANRNSMLPAREEVSVPIPRDEVLQVELAPGEMSLHHVMALHGSERNRSDSARVGFAVRYIAGDLRQANGAKPGATLVAGLDHGTFEMEQRPAADLDPEAVQRYYAMLRKMAQAVFPERNKGR
ncbi:phytanoyl-CoA dioxygenase family protein [Pseudoruegeria sp. SHC-113]|uniref:phytanoyl-CoA dioxygenase family protein n=1 Tax=Pseudoruegeria sp. SHC-113 TaxID=2855439 RepID=UPI0021BA6413|nr:phytanoyl-CoA dioxygenase family protein [Pseudoruegeria sp. SHC-113]MCT8160150.1 phytanoyl-CoA dioxygenase family protein [Pseudoruegeria sp. SHC-113]